MSGSQNTTVLEQSHDLCLQDAIALEALIFLEAGAVDIHEERVFFQDLDETISFICGAQTDENITVLYRWATEGRDVVALDRESREMVVELEIKKLLLRDHAKALAAAKIKAKDARDKRYQEARRGKKMVFVGAA